MLFRRQLKERRAFKITKRCSWQALLKIPRVTDDKGLPLLGLIPIIGRLFTAPTKDNRQVDIVIAITPKVIRAPSILPEDEVERQTGSLAVPTSGSLEALIIQEEREELLAAARRLPTVAQVQLPDRKVEDAPAYVKTNSTQTVRSRRSRKSAESRSSDDKYFNG